MHKWAATQNLFKFTLTLNSLQINKILIELIFLDDNEKNKLEMDKEMNSIPCGVGENVEELGRVVCSFRSGNNLGNNNKPAFVQIVNFKIVEIGKPSDFFILLNNPEENT